MLPTTPQSQATRPLPGRRASRDSTRKIFRKSCVRTEFGTEVKSYLFVPASEYANHFMEKSKALASRKVNYCEKSGTMDVGRVMCH